MTSVVCNIEGESETYTYMQMLISFSRKTVGPFIYQKDPLCAWCGGPKDPLKVVINGSP